MKLTDNFTLEELTASSLVRKGISNEPTEEIKQNLLKLAMKLEEVRTLLGHPMTISSGYRSPEVNRIVGGSRNSAHMQGFAADFICPGFGTPYEVCDAIAKSGITFDQIIHEFGSWIHLGITDVNMRQDLLTICSAKQGYRRGIFTCLDLAQYKA